MARKAISWDTLKARRQRGREVAKRLPSATRSRPRDPAEAHLLACANAARVRGAERVVVGISRGGGGQVKDPNSTAGDRQPGRASGWLAEQSLQKGGSVDFEVAGNILQNAAQSAGFQRCVTRNRDVVRRAFQG